MAKLEEELSLEFETLSLNCDLDEINQNFQGFTLFLVSFFKFANYCFLF